jgi:hypothetical protein
MNYFTALGITVAIVGGLFLFAILAVPIEVIWSQFEMPQQIVAAVLTVTIYVASLQKLNKRSKVA